MSSSPLFASAALAAALLAASPASAQSFSFEDGNLRGWLQGGTAFRHQPTLGNNIAVRRPGESPGHDGDYWVGSFEARPSASIALGATHGDAPTGALISPPFTIANNSIELLVGGGMDPARLRVDLLVERSPSDRGGSNPSGIGSLVSVPEGQFKVEASATGNDSETMRRVSWDARALIGRRGRIMIVDEATGAWGHINVDDIRPSNRIVGPVAQPVPPVAMPVGGGDVTVTSGDPPVAVPVGGMAPAPDAPRARFRVTALGFVVERQSYDSINGSDGRGDEVFVRGDTVVIDHSGRAQPRQTVRTALIGELGQYPGGSGRPGPLDAAGRMGGLMSRDTYPATGAWIEPPRRRPDDLPMVLWEGELVRGGNAAIIVPTIWEWDGDGATAEERRWDSGLVRALLRNTPRLLSLMSAWPASLRSPLFTDFTGLLITNDGSRPIGSSRRWSGLPVGPISHTAPMRVSPLILTYDNAVAATTGPANYRPRHLGGDGVSIEPLFAIPRGILAIPMVDEHEMEGDYTLFVKFEQLP